MREVILPRHNESDLEDIPASLRRDLRYHFVDSLDQVLALALEPADNGLTADDGGPKMAIDRADPGSAPRTSR